MISASGWLFNEKYREFVGELSKYQLLKQDSTAQVQSSKALTHYTGTCISRTHTNCAVTTFSALDSAEHLDQEILWLSALPTKPEMRQLKASSTFTSAAAAAASSLFFQLRETQRMQVNLNVSLAFYWLSLLTDSATVPALHHSWQYHNPASSCLPHGNKSVAATSLLSVVLFRKISSRSQTKTSKNPTDNLTAVCSVRRPSKKCAELVTAGKMSVRETLVTNCYSWLELQTDVWCKNY